MISDNYFISFTAFCFQQNLGQEEKEKEEEWCFGSKHEESICFSSSAGVSNRQRQGDIRSWYLASSFIPDNTQQDDGSAISAAAAEMIAVIIWLLEASV